MVEKIRETLSAFNAASENLLPFTFDFVDPRSIQLLKKNARYMDNPTFAQLVSNVSQDKNLTSIPLCVRQEDGSLLVLSGNHRIEAAVHAGVEHVVVMILKKELSREEQVARQLSHNALAGKDDMVILRELWMEIEDMSLKEYSGLDQVVIGELEKMKLVSIPSPRFDYETITFLFLPEEKEVLDQILSEIDDYFRKENTYIASVNYYDKAFSCISGIKSKYNIVSTSAAFLKLLTLAEEKLREME